MTPILVAAALAPSAALVAGVVRRAKAAARHAVERARIRRDLEDVTQFRRAMHAIDPNRRAAS
jgi:hypothetical protein